MSRITKSEAQLLDGAHRLALARAKMPPRIQADEEFVRQFLIREIIALHRQGEADMQALANAAVGRLRDHLQIRQSARRLAEGPHQTPPKAEPMSGGSAAGA